MFVLDIESGGVESTSAVLSVALVYINLDNENTWESMYGNSLFVKLKLKEQIEKYNRTIDKDTIAWWNKQCEIVKKTSFIPSSRDLSAITAIGVLRRYINEQSTNPKRETVWVRGSLDSVALDSLCRAVGEEPLFPWWNYRDVRTYVDLSATEPVRGYCDIDTEKYPGTWDRNVVMKHCPVDDICLDAMMLLYPN